MIFGNMDFIGAFELYPDPVARALKYLREMDLESLPAGEYEQEGRDLYIKIRDKMTQSADSVYPEVHRHYVDLQYTPSGNEFIGYAHDSGGCEVLEDRLQDLDICFYRSVKNETWLNMQPGSFAVFFPWDIHRPGCAVDQPVLTRKIVVKIRTSLFGALDDRPTNINVVSEFKGDDLWK